MWNIHLRDRILPLEENISLFKGKRPAAEGFEGKVLLLSREKVEKSGVEEGWRKERNASVLTRSHFTFAATSPVSAPIVGEAPFDSGA